MSNRSLVACTLALVFVAVPLAAQDARHHRGPPPEALAACREATRGAACSFTGPRGEALRGTCVAPAGLPLACMPAGGPHGGPPHGPPPEALSACRDIAIGDACAFDAPHGTIEGTCRATPDGHACVPAHMLEDAP
jgi:hypothetical protein